MKTGKFIPLGIYENVKIGYGTVDYKNLKSIYLKLNSWVEPEDYDDFEFVVRKSRKRIIEHIYNKKNPLLKRQSLVDLDIRTKGIKKNKRSFMNLEVTLFVNQHFDVKSDDTKSMIKEYVVEIIDNLLTDKNLYNFNLRKNDKV